MPRTHAFLHVPKTNRVVKNTTLWRRNDQHYITMTQMDAYTYSSPCIACEATWSAALQHEDLAAYSRCSPRSLTRAHL
jgi:hypothetical protein